VRIKSNELLAKIIEAHGGMTRKVYDRSGGCLASKVCLSVAFVAGLSSAVYHSSSIESTAIKLEFITKIKDQSVNHDVYAAP